MDIAYLEQNIRFAEALLIECAACQDKKGCKKRERTEKFLKRAQAELEWKKMVDENNERR